MHTLAVTKRAEEVEDLFSSMDSGQFNDGISPGLTCFNARVLAYVQKNAWEDLLAFHSRMQEDGIAFSPTSFQGVLLASFRLGNRARALEVIEGALRSGMKMDHDCCELSMKLLIGDKLETGSIPKMRTKLRDIGERNMRLKSASINLSRALRMAEVEEQRQPNDGLKLHEIVSRRDRAWNDALQQLVDFTRVMETGDPKSVSSHNT